MYTYAYMPRTYIHLLLRCFFHAAKPASTPDLTTIQRGSTRWDFSKPIIPRNIYIYNIQIIYTL